ncbi:MAG: hypothetical protein GX178_02335 [Acidobacteria bacterium]|nr:hypothetical protein [Thermoanaerobaculia bacterium]NLN10431.1 hypothetical protein [Acidobacteriota bacterium]MBP7813118.1 hypothetical protein [Thermoanaerobaculia bacterium]HPA95785.1 hypothetical protein [Thermoanaerobaculia bacterium]HQN38564.1 hypothetical protein [Thermoanaerobaculia bacterium]
MLPLLVPLASLPAADSLLRRIVEQVAAALPELRVLWPEEEGGLGAALATARSVVFLEHDPAVIPTSVGVELLRAGEAPSAGDDGRYAELLREAAAPAARRARVRLLGSGDEPAAEAAEIVELAVRCTLRLLDDWALSPA